MPEQQNNSNQQHFYQPPSSNTSDAEAFAFNFHRLLSGKFFVELVKVTAIHGEAPNLTVDILPLLTQVDPTGAMIETSVIYGAPVFRLQRGASAVIMDPSPGDIGLALICDGDTTVVRANREPSVPGGRRRHSRSDAVYMGGVLNAAPTEYVKFTGNGIEVKSPGTVNINGLRILPDGRLQLVDGSIVDKHTHGGVSSGSSSTAPLGG